MTGLTDAGWRAARLALLEREKAHMREADALAEARRALPPVAVDGSYEFEGPDGPETLADLFGDHSQLAVYHFMYGADWSEGCPSCSFWGDNLDGIADHLAARDVSLVLVGTAPYDTLAAYGRRLGWRHRWSSAGESGFSEAFGVRFSAGELETKAFQYNFRDGAFGGPEAPGLSTFSKDADGRIWHHYSTYARGLESFNGAYKLLDLMPKGRDEAGLSFSMAWLKRRDQYDNQTTKT